MKIAKDCVLGKIVEGHANLWGTCVVRGTQLGTTLFIYIRNNKKSKMDRSFRTFLTHPSSVVSCHISFGGFRRET